MTNQRAAGSKQKAAGGGQPSVEIEIEELVLHGFSPADRLRIGAALEGELTRLLGESGIPPELARVSGIERMDGGQLEPSAGASAQDLGAGIAHAVYGSLGRRP